MGFVIWPCVMMSDVGQTQREAYDKIRYCNLTAARLRETGNIVRF